jgi:hypothetical protein
MTADVSVGEGGASEPVFLNTSKLNEDASQLGRAPSIGMLSRFLVVYLLGRRGIFCFGGERIDFAWFEIANRIETPEVPKGGGG